MLTQSQITKLKATGKVVDVENDGMDEGRFFVHLGSRYTYNEGYGVQHTKSFGSYAEVVRTLKTVTANPLYAAPMADIV